MLSHEKYQPDFDNGNGYFWVKTVYKIVRYFNCEMKMNPFDWKSFLNLKPGIHGPKPIVSGPSGSVLVLD